MILHVMKKSSWEEIKSSEFFGQKNIQKDGFIHCSTIQFFWRVVHNFKDIPDELVILCIDESKLTSEVRYEDNDGCGRFYPHIYGLINKDAVKHVLPYLKDEHGNYIKNKEFSDIIDF